MIVVHKHTLYICFEFKRPALSLISGYMSLGFVIILFILAINSV